MVEALNKVVDTSINDIDDEYNNSMEEVEVELDGEDSQTLADKTKISVEEEEIYPMENITVDKGFYTVYELKRKHDKKLPLVVLDSDFQRGNVWSTRQQRELVESVLMGLPLPIFYYNEDKKGRLIVIDGRQRLTALFEFMDNKFKLNGLKILKHLNGKSFHDLDPIMQNKIEDYQIMAHVIKPPTPDRIIFDIFDRVNRAGTKLNKQEIRNALYQGNATLLLKYLNQHDAFKQATDGAFEKDRRMKDSYIILRFIAFYLYFDKRLYKYYEEVGSYELYTYRGDIDEVLGLTMEYLNKASEEELREIEEVTINALEQVSFYLGKNAFRLVDIDKNGKVKKYPININIFENIMYAMTILPYKNESIRHGVKTAFDDMKNSNEFRNSINNHRDSEIKVKARYDMIQKIVEDIL